MHFCDARINRSVPLSEDPQDPDKEVGDIHIDIQGGIHRVVQRLRELLGAVDIIADIQGEQAGDQPVDPALRDTEDQQDHLADDHADEDHGKHAAQL